MSSLDLQLLLRHPDGSSLLDRLDRSSLAFADRTAIHGRGARRSHDGDQNAMDQGWGVLYPEGRRELLEAIEELVQWRRELIAAAHSRSRTRGEAPRVRDWAIAPGDSAREFLNHDYLRLPSQQRPKYLLILGDLDGVPLALSRELSREAHVGRLCLPALADYERYARKVIAYERAQMESSGAQRLLLMSTSTAARPDGAVDSGHRHMIEALHADFRSPAAELGLEPERVQLLGPRGELERARDWPGLRRELATSESAVWMSLSHGSGDPGWSADEQREHQGRMNFGGGEELSLADVSEGPFLPGGIWFNYACFSGGTPKHSAFEPWLRELVSAGAYAQVPDVLATQARESAFVAYQAQLALANPRGPLAIIGHGDLAFAYAFMRARGQELRRRAVRDGRVRGAVGRPDHEPVRAVLQALVAGSRAGLALAKLRSAMTEADEVLLRHWQDRRASDSALARLLIKMSEDASQPAAGSEAGRVLAAVRAVTAELGAGGVTLERVARRAGCSAAELLAVFGRALDDSSLLIHVGHNWMARHDLGGWFLLGDPACRVAGVERGRGREAGLDELGLELPEGVGRARLEEAIAAYAYFVEARGEREASEVAGEYGLDVVLLRSLVERWRRAGRAALGG